MPVSPVMQIKANGCIAIDIIVENFTTLIVTIMKKIKPPITPFCECGRMLKISFDREFCYHCIKEIAHHVMGYDED